MLARRSIVLLFVFCLSGCDNAAKQQRDNAAHRAAVEKELIEQGEAMQMQQSENETNGRQEDQVSEAPND